MTEDDGPQRVKQWTLPDKYLPSVPVRDLPEPLGLRKITGASVIILATAIGSGETVLWPYITSQVGFVFLWAAVVGFGMQFFLNMEIERYTLATGESAITGFARHWKPWWWLFIIFALFQNFWPGWATGAATTLGFTLGAEDFPVVPVTLAALVAIGITLTLSPVVYQYVEKIQFVLVALIMLFVVVAIPVGTTADAWGAVFTEGIGDIGFPIGEANLSIALLLGALAFAGAGGANNLVQSNYIRDKGLGMGQHIPKIVSPITGHEEAKPSLGYTFPLDEENMRRWRGWWKVANREQFITFFVIGVVSLVVLSVLAYSTVGVGRADQEDLEFLFLEGQILQDSVAPWFGTAFWAAATLALFSTNLGIIDYTSRLIADQLKIHAAKDSSFWTESKIYVGAVWLMIVVGSIILLSGVDQPFVLVVISSSIAGVQMFIYSGLLIMLNRRALPRQLRISGVRLAVIAAAFLFFGFLSVMLVIDNF
ncbi:Nramp family divalent metal transporter [Actinophytocola gossypii]|uniref:Nramp family divalent metal transporter n=1 Tax=Actinophytocola gossypii TaxID=2812003 RepID=A0ABT2J336_9PSEU|nr:Nramp family divalent metal transporter [Actinophytocola gossypii]MCT2582181.1 Nramp family divalent metal transporter [Actinophytocola gossypii]